MDDQQGAARIEMLIGTMHRLVVQIAAAADAKDSTHVGGAIRPVEAQLVEGLHRKVRRSRRRQLCSGRLDHIGRNVDAIDVEALG